MEIKSSTYKEIFELHPSPYVEGFVLKGSTEESLEKNVNEVLAALVVKKFIRIENPWVAIYKVQREDGKIDVCLVAETTEHLDVPRWSAFVGSYLSIGEGYNLQLSTLFGWLTDMKPQKDLTKENS